MNIEIDKIYHIESEGFSIWIDEEQNFNLKNFLNDISVLNIETSEILLKSFGPAQIIEKYTTKSGDFFIHIEFDEFAGTTIYSENSDLMNKIFELMISSGHYILR